MTGRPHLRKSPRPASPAHHGRLLRPIDKTLIGARGRAAIDARPAQAVRCGQLKPRRWRQPVAWYSQTWNWFDGAWHEGNPPLMGPRTHAAWLGSTVFDGARVFEGVMPDIDRHCAPRQPLRGRARPQADDGGGRDRRARPRGRQEVRAGRGALRQADVLGRGGRARDHHGGSGIDAVLPLPLRGADAGARRRSR